MLMLICFSLVILLPSIPLREQYKHRENAFTLFVYRGFGGINFGPTDLEQQKGSHEPGDRYSLQSDKRINPSVPFWSEVLHIARGKFSIFGSAGPRDSIPWWNVIVIRHDYLPQQWSSRINGKTKRIFEIHFTSISLNRYIFLLLPFILLDRDIQTIVLREQYFLEIHHLRAPYAA